VLGNAKDKLPIVYLLFNWWIDVNAGKSSKLTVLSPKQWKSDSSVNFTLKCLEFDRKAIAIDCCNYSGNLAVTFGTVISIYRYKRSNSSPILDRLTDVKLSLYARFLSYAHPYISFASNNHCQLLYLRVEEESDETHSTKCGRVSSVQRTSNLLDCEQLHLPVLQCSQSDPTDCLNASFSTPNKTHAAHVIGPVSSRLTCRIELRPNMSLAIVSCDADVLLCRQLSTQPKTYEDEQFEIVEKDGYSQVFQKYKDSASTNRPRIQQLHLQPLCVDQITAHPLQDRLESNDKMPLEHRKRTIGFNFFIVMPNEVFAYRLHERQIVPIDPLKFAFKDQIKHILFDAPYVKVITHTSLQVYWSGLCDSFSLSSQIELSRLTCQLPVVAFQLFCQPILLCQHNFLAPDKLLHTMNDLIVITLHSGSYTGYALRKPSLEQLLKESNAIFGEKSPQTNEKQMQFVFFLICLCKRRQFNRSQRDRTDFIDICQQMFNLLSSVFDSKSSLFWNNWIQTLFDYLGLQIYEFERFNQKLDLTFAFFDHISLLFLHYKLKKLIFSKGTVLEEELMTNELPPTHLIRSLDFIRINPHLLDLVLLNYNFKLSKVPKLCLFDFLQKLDNEHHLLGKFNVFLNLNESEEMNSLLDQVSDSVWTLQIQSLFEQIQQFPLLFQTLLSRKARIMINILLKAVRHDKLFWSRNDRLELISDPLLRFLVLDTLYSNSIKTIQCNAKVLNLIVRGYIAIISQRWTDDLVKTKFHIGFSDPKSMQSPLLNLLAPLHATELNTARESSENDLETVVQCQTLNQICFCSKCLPCFVKLQQLLYAHGVSNECRQEMNLFCETYLPKSVAWTIQVLYVDFELSIDLLLDHCRESIVFFCIEKHVNRDPTVWRRLIRKLEHRLSGQTDCKLMHQLLYHFSTHLDLNEMTDILPIAWKEVAAHYLQIAIQKHQAKELREELRKRAERMLLPASFNAF
jgi:hypothetical protein